MQNVVYLVYNFDRYKKMKTRFRSIFLLGLLISFCGSSFSQNNKQINEKYVLIIDVQEDYTRGVVDTNSTTELIQIINSVIENSNPDKIIYIKQVHRVLTLSFKGTTVDTLAISPLDSRLKIVGKHIFYKSESDAFLSDELVEFLSFNKAKEVVIVGLMAEKCVSKTAMGAKKQGYDVLIIPEAIIGETKKKKSKAINKLEKKGVQIMPLNELLKYL